MLRAGLENQRNDDAGEDNGCDGNGGETGNQHLGQQLRTNHIGLFLIQIQSGQSLFNNDLGAGITQQAADADSSGHGEGDVQDLTGDGAGQNDKHGGEHQHTNDGPNHLQQRGNVDALEVAGQDGHQGQRQETESVGFLERSLVQEAQFGEQNAHDQVHNVLVDDLRTVVDGQVGQPHGDDGDDGQLGDGEVAGLHGSGPGLDQLDVDLLAGTGGGESGLCTGSQQALAFLLQHGGSDGHTGEHLECAQQGGVSSQLAAANSVGGIRSHNGGDQTTGDGGGTDQSPFTAEEQSADGESESSQTDQTDQCDHNGLPLTDQLFQVHHGTQVDDHQSDTAGTHHGSQAGAVNCGGGDNAGQITDQEYGTANDNGRNHGFRLVGNNVTNTKGEGEYCKTE